MKVSSLLVQPLWTSAENPPMISTRVEQPVFGGMRVGQCDGGDGDPLVHDADAIFVSHIIRGADQILRQMCDLVVDPAGSFLVISAKTVQQ